MVKQQLKDWRILSLKVRRVQIGDLEESIEREEVRSIDNLLTQYLSNYQTVFDMRYPPK